jgi:hypothetical protein
MRTRKKAPETDDLKIRKYWHAYHLQNLSANRFIRAVGDILKSEKFLIPPDRAVRTRV